MINPNAVIDPVALKAFFDAHPTIFKTGAVQSDGYLSTLELGHALGAAVDIPNPTPVTQVLKPFRASDILQCVGATNLAKFASSPMFDAIRQDIRDQNRTGIEDEAVVAQAAGMLTPTELSAIQAVLQATMDDPSWTPTVHGPSLLESQFSAGCIAHSIIDQALGRTQ